MKILVVDDIAFNRRYFLMLLEKHGYEVLCAATGEEAIELLQDNVDIRLVFCDLGMPDMDGIEVLKHAQQLKRFNDEGPIGLPPFVMVTEETQEKILSKARLIGYMEIIKKPPQSDKVMQIVRQVEAGTYTGKSDVFQAILYSDATLESPDELKEIGTVLGKNSFELFQAHNPSAAFNLICSHPKLELIIGVVQNFNEFNKFLDGAKAHYASKKKPLPKVVCCLDPKLIDTITPDAEMRVLPKPIVWDDLIAILKSIQDKDNGLSNEAARPDSVLVVDDVVFSRTSLVNGLKRLGMHVYDTGSAQEAIKLYQSHNEIKIVLTKKILEQVSAENFFQALNVIKRYSDEGVLPPAEFVVMLDPQDKDHGRMLTRIGVSKILQKPIPVEKIQQELQRIFEGLKPKSDDPDADQTTGNSAERVPPELAGLEELAKEKAKQA